MTDGNDSSKSFLSSILTIRKHECRYTGGLNHRTHAKPPVQLIVVHKNVSMMPYLETPSMTAVNTDPQRLLSHPDDVLPENMH